jgi:hydrogenase nickel incorporation protein HypA/HybF
MHELGIAQEIVSTVEASLASRPGFRARVVRLRLGTLRGVEPEALRFAFEVLGRDRPAVAGATLEMQMEAPRFRCRACGAENPLADWAPLCPACGSADGAVSGGDEIVVETIDAEGPEEESAEGER